VTRSAPSPLALTAALEFNEVALPGVPAQHLADLRSPSLWRADETTRSPIAASALAPPDRRRTPELAATWPRRSSRHDVGAISAR